MVKFLDKGHCSFWKTSVIYRNASNMKSPFFQDDYLGNFMNTALVINYFAYSHSSNREANPVI